MTILELGKRLYTVPQSWNELTHAQLRDCLMILHSDMEVDQARLHLLRSLIGATWFRMWLHGVKELDDKLYLVDWMLEKNTLTENLLPWYRDWYGPASGFNNLLISEFIFTEEYYRLWRNEELPEDDRHYALDKLVGILYRPGRKNYDKIRNPAGDIREPFNDNLIEYNAFCVGLWPFPVKQAIAFWYQGCQQSLVAEFPKVFGGGGGGESVYGLWDILYNIAEKNVLGDFAKVEGQLLKTVLMVLTKTMVEAERIEKQFKK